MFLCERERERGKQNEEDVKAKIEVLQTLVKENRKKGRGVKAEFTPGDTFRTLTEWKH